jgi:hypothetical protein
MNFRKIIDGWIIISIFIIILLIAINIPYTTLESSTEKEFYTELEPYNTTETYYEKEPYIENVPLKLNTTLKWYISDLRFKDEFDLIATLKNTHNVKGEFWVTFHLESTNGTYDYTTDRVLLMPGESYQIKKTFGGIFSYLTSRVNQPTKEEKRFRDVPRERTVTKNLEIEKSHEVVKTRKNTLTLLQRILKYPPHYEPDPPVEVPVQIDEEI